MLRLEIEKWLFGSDEDELNLDPLLFEDEGLEDVVGTLEEIGCSIKSYNMKTYTGWNLVVPFTVLKEDDYRFYSIHCNILTNDNFVLTREDF